MRGIRVKLFHRGLLHVYSSWLRISLQSKAELSSQAGHFPANLTSGERNTGLTKYLLEDRGRSQGAGGRNAARQLRGGASPRGRAQHPALDGKFDGASRNGTRVRIEPRRQAGRQLGAIEADLERQARGRRASS